MKLFYIIGLLLVKDVSLLTDLVYSFLLENPSGHGFGCDFPLKLLEEILWQSGDRQGMLSSSVQLETLMSPGHVCSAEDAPVECAKGD